MSIIEFQPFNADPLDLEKPTQKVGVAELGSVPELLQSARLAKGVGEIAILDLASSVEESLDNSRMRMGCGGRFKMGGSGRGRGSLSAQGTLDGSLSEFTPSYLEDDDEDLADAA